MNSFDNILNRIQQVIADYADIETEASTLALDDSLFDAGMSSRASVGVMLGLESEFDIQFPEELLKREVFESVRSIAIAVESLIQK
jgi:acyl carrier protein